MKRLLTCPLAAFLITAAPAVHAGKTKNCQLIELNASIQRESWTPEFWEIVYPDKAERARAQAGLEKGHRELMQNCDDGIPDPSWNLICYEAAKRYENQLLKIKLLREAADALPIGAESVVEILRVEGALTAAEKKRDALIAAVVREHCKPGDLEAWHN